VRDIAGAPEHNIYIRVIGSELPFAVRAFTKPRSLRATGETKVCNAIGKAGS
jgi:hypothetical protein